MNNPYKNMDLRSMLLARDSETIARENAANIEAETAVFRRFLAHFQSGRCFLCGHSLGSFIPNEPCYHWLLMPSGSTKKAIVSSLSRPTSFFQLSSFLGWIANSETMHRNISDVNSEVPPGNLFAQTIRYRDLEWSFACGQSDYMGHLGSVAGHFPHYHLQLKRNGNVVLKFGDCHIPLTEHDLINLELKRQAPDLFVLEDPFSQGIGILEKVTARGHLEEFASTLRVVDAPSKGAFHRSTTLEAAEGETISGDDFIAAYEQSKRTGESISTIFARKFPKVKVRSILSPVEDAATLSTRGGRDKR